MEVAAHNLTDEGFKATLSLPKKELDQIPLAYCTPSGQRHSFANVI